MIEFYGINGCIYCKMAMQLLDENGIQYRYILVTQDTHQYYKKINEMETYPQLFLLLAERDDYTNMPKRLKIGGYQDLHQLLSICEAPDNERIIKFIHDNIDTPIVKYMCNTNKLRLLQVICQERKLLGAVKKRKPRVAKVVKTTRATKVAKVKAAKAAKVAKMTKTKLKKTTVKRRSR